MRTHERHQIQPTKKPSVNHNGRPARRQAELRALFFLRSDPVWMQEGLEAGRTGRPGRAWADLVG